MSIYLEESELTEAYVQSVKFTDESRLPFPEFKRIADNLPNPTLPDYYPDLTDGTLGALMEEKPMRILAQLQTGRFKPVLGLYEDYDKYHQELINILWESKITKQANSDAPFFYKLQIVDHKSSIYGGQAVKIIGINEPHYQGGDFVLIDPYKVHFEAGAKSDLGADYMWHDQEFTKLQLKRLIRGLEKSEDKQGWDIQELKKLVDSEVFGAPKDTHETAAESMANSFKRVVTLTTCYHRGLDAPFYTLLSASNAEGGIDSSKILRKFKNDDPTGDIPVVFKYNKQDLINPFGVSEVAKAGPTQNALDLHTSAHALGTIRGLEPNIKIQGNPETSGMDIDTITQDPGQAWFVGDGDASFVSSNNAIHSQFPDTMSMYKAQVQNLHGSSDMSVSGASSGDNTFSKTHQGVKFQEQRMSSRDNFSRQRVDEFLSRLGKGLMHKTLTMVEGQTIVEITESQRDRLLALDEKVPEDIENTEVLTIVMADLKDAVIDYEVEPNSSRLSDEGEAKETILEIIRVLFELGDLDRLLAEDGLEIHFGELIKRLLSVAGIEQFEKIINEMSAEKLQAMQMQQQQVMTQGEGEAMQEEEQPIEGEVVDEPMPEQPPVTTDQIVEQLVARGWDEDRITQAISLIEGAGSE